MPDEAGGGGVRGCVGGGLEERCLDVLEGWGTTVSSVEWRG